MQKSEIRKDYFLDRYVIIAPKRNKRPDKVAKVPDENAGDCYFCPPLVDTPGRETTVFEKKDEHGKWKIKVIKNKFPALSLDNIKAYGSQELVIETPEHNKEIHELPLNHIEEIIEAYIKRYVALKKMEGVCYVLVFKNEGGKAGASIPHSHSQIYALPMIPPKIADESSAMDDYIRKHNSCPYCDIIKSEKAGPRVIWEDKHLFVLAPYASESPYGAWFIPKRHVHSIDFLTKEEISSFAHALKKLLLKLDEIDVSYNYFFLNSLELESHHMIMKLAPRPNVWAGLELGTGIVINPIAPEDAVKFYNEK
jgi:UDPglucose--hexose-1-phosphate uridylyltransferase